MKNLIALFLLSGSLVLSACSSDNAQPDPGGETAGRPAAVEPVVHMASEVVRKELTQVYNEYIDVKNALVKSDAATARTNAGELLGKLSFDSSTLTAEERADWEKQMQSMKSAAGEIAATDDLEQQRSAFADLSTAMEATVRNLGLYGTTVYRQYCPMAFNDQGGFWLAGEEEVNNPYFGDEMLHCGVVEDTLKF